MKYKFLKNDQLELTTDSIGYISSAEGRIFLNQKYDNIKHQSKKFDFQPHDIIQLPNKTIVISTTDRLLLFNENFESIKSINFSGSMHNLSVACDMNGNIFAKGLRTGLLTKLDCNLEEIKSVVFDKKDFSCNHIAIANDRLYMCLSSQKAVSVFSLNLEELYTDRINDSVPLQIKVINDIACVTVESSANKKETHFYHLPHLNFIFKCPIFGAILAHADMFYILSAKESFMYVFQRCTAIDKMLVNFRSKTLDIVNGKLACCYPDKNTIEFVKYI